MSLEAIYSRISKKNIHAWTSAILAIEYAMEAHPEQAADWAAAFSAVSTQLFEEMACLGDLADTAEGDSESDSGESA